MTILGSKRAFFGALLAASLAAGSAHAQSAQEKEQARQLFEKGKQERDKGDWSSALRSFKAADAIMQVPTTRLAVARAQVALGQLVEAREAAHSVEKIPVAKKETLPFIDARASAKELAAELDTRVPSLTVKIVNAPAEPVTVAIDGNKVQESELSAKRLNPGKHVIVGTAGAREVKVAIDLAERDATEASLDFTPPKQEPIAAPKDYDQPQNEGKRSPLVWAGLGIAVVGVGVGSVTGILSMSEKSTADESCRDGKCPPQAHDALDASKTFATVSTIGFIAAGVGVVLAGVGLALGKTPKQEAGLTVHFTGSGVGGRF